MAGLQNELYVVSVGPGGPEYLTQAAENALKSAGCLVAAKRHLALGKDHPNVVLMEGLDGAFSKIEENLKNGSVAVAVSGDAGIFSLLPRLKKHFPERRVAVIPGVSALQALCAALGETWDGAEIVSLHGAGMPAPKIAGIVAHSKKTFFFCGPGRDPSLLCRVLAERGFNDRVQVAVGERLTYPDERVVQGKPSDLGGLAFDPLSVAAALNSSPLPLPRPRPGDDEFSRSPSVPMTRGEVRTVILDRLRLTPESVVWDIGAGTGSVAVACSQLCPYGEVHAVERLPEAVEVLRANKEIFRAYNLFIREGNAKSLLESLPRPTHVFVGGSGGELREILGHVRTLGAAGGEISVVVSGVTLKTIGAAYEILSGEGFGGLDVTQIAVSRGKTAGDSVILTAQNPITLLSARTAHVDI